MKQKVRIVRKEHIQETDLQGFIRFAEEQPFPITTNYFQDKLCMSPLNILKKLSIWEWEYW